MDFDINDLNFINHLFNPLFIINFLCMIGFSSIVFYIVIAKCDIKSCEILLIFILNTIHCLCGISGILFCILKLVYGYQFLQSEGIPCLLNSVLTIFSTRIEIITVGFLSFMRYTIVCHNIKKDTKFWMLLYFAIIIPVFVLYIYPIIINDATPPPSMLICLPYLKPKPQLFPLAVINPFVLLVPCCASTISYFLIGIKAFKKLNEMNKEASATSDKEMLNRIKQQRFSLILQLIVVFTIFNICYMPAYITMILRATIGYTRSPFADAMITQVIEISRTIDPIVTIIFQPELNHEFKVILTKSKAKFKNFIVNLFK